MIECWGGDEEIAEENKGSDTGSIDTADNCQTLLGRVIVLTALDVPKELASQLDFKQYFDSAQDSETNSTVPTIQITKIVRSSSQDK
mmetsp:Transcript_33028/g.42204  ORF Transcript_33028/g.42204 Transcript_33028/m.42204 type:complete len:87 (+) Transcript_33028:27-287(+)